jgi:hypothetical protein
MGALIGAAYFFGKKKAKATEAEEGARRAPAYEAGGQEWNGAEMATTANVAELPAERVEKVKRAELYGN